jgi:transcriptional regulator with XRE-family HTH domain
MPSNPTPERPWVPVIDGRALRRARVANALTQRELIERCAQLGTNIDRGNLHRAERGQPGSIGIKKLPAVVQVLGIPHITEILTQHGRELAGYGSPS